MCVVYKIDSQGNEELAKIVKPTRACRREEV